MTMTEQRLIDIKPLMTNGWHLVQTGESNRFIRSMSLADVPVVEAKPVVHAQWQKQWCDSSMIGHMYEECPICGCMILDTEKFWGCKFCPNCGTEMLGD
jgi:hypothetical protein